MITGAPRRTWPPSEIAALRQLIGAGLSIDNIALTLNRPRASVARRVNVEANAQRPQRPWTEAELDMVLDMRDADAPYKEIETATGRARTSIQKKLRALDPEFLRKRRAKKRAAAVPLPVARSDWMLPITREQLMRGKA